MHTFRIYITVLSLLSIVGSSSGAIAQNLATNSVISGVETSQNDGKVDDDTIPGGTRVSFLQTKEQEEQDITEEKQHRGSGRVSYH